MAAFAMTAAALTTVACGSTISGTAQPAVDNGTVPAVSATSTPKPTSSLATTSKPAPTTTTRAPGETDFEAEVNDCVKLGGTTTDATIDKASCGSREANYKVIEKQPKSSQCIGDADNYYAETINGVEVGAFCLDIDWEVEGCMDVGGDDPQRIDCSATVGKGVKVTDIKHGTADVGDCGSGTGYVYDQRHFVVCVQDL
ncbi:hypothetical protein GCM10023318_11580 [Nocardia callitridis]|uniref:LppU protein n=2 Tax=Nocardia callitridis TaxID=648753 RepID=A0ABP9JWF5_9NOCA